MDQTFINWIIAGVGAGIGWIMRIIWTEIKLVQKNQREIESNISDNYVRKDDYRVDIAEIKGMLGRIFDRLENKADK
jgi:uncharacterized membrane-anchored protein YhcB (DUF1043 family)